MDKLMKRRRNADVERTHHGQSEWQSSSDFITLFGDVFVCFENNLTIMLAVQGAGEMVRNGHG